MSFLLKCFFFFFFGKSLLKKCQQFIMGVFFLLPPGIAYF